VSAQSPLQSEASSPEQSQRDEHPVGVARDLRGLLIGDIELRERIGISVSCFYAFKRQGRYDFLMVTPQPTNVTSYSGTLVQKWLDGQGAGGPRRVSRPVKRVTSAR
jgi:hypothetical protein